MYKVIIADDEPMIRSGLCRRVDWESLGFEVVLAADDGKEVLDFLSDHQVDVILSDIRMFQISGLDIARTVQEKYPDSKVILLSGYREFEYAREAVRCDVYDYLLKPIDYEELTSLFQRIREELDTRHHEEQLMRKFGDEEYDLLLQLMKSAADSVLGAGEETYLICARLKPVLRDLPEDVRGIFIRQMLDRLQKEIVQKDPELAAQYAEKLKALPIAEETSDAQGEKTPGQSEPRTLQALLTQMNDDLVARGLVSEKKAAESDIMKKALNYIDNHLDQKFTYQDVAAYVYLSPRHFIRRFYAETHMTFSHYVSHARLERAARLLSEGLATPEDVSGMVGYEDDKYFSRLFRETYGCTAREYQQLTKAEKA